jgi:hypothetical protein
MEVMDVDALCKGGLTEIAMSKGMPITDDDIGAVRSAAQILRLQAAEITRLREELAAITADRDGLQLAFNGSEKLRLLTRKSWLEAEAERDAAYAKGLEDAAQVADGAPDWTDHACDIAAAIRAVKGDKT